MARLAGPRVSAAASATLLAALAGGCGHSAAFRCPLEGGPPWMEVESEHFTVRTDAPPAEAERMARELEALRTAQLAAWGGGFDPPARLEVVVLRNQTELGEFVDRPWASFRRVLGYYEWGARPRVVTAFLMDREAPSLALPPFREQAESRAAVAEGEVLRHELAHHLAGQVLLRQPPWLAEGLAHYLAATRLGTWQGRPAAAVGLGGGEAWKEGEHVPAAALFAWRPGEPGPGYYQSSWLLVHWLVNARGADFAAFQRRLARAEDPGLAWKAAFPDLDPADGSAMASLDRQIDAYRRSGSYRALRVALPALEPRLRRRQMAPAEIHALRAEIFLRSFLPPDDSQSRTDAEIEASLREDSSGLFLALLLAAAGRAEQALKLGREASAARPDDWRGWALLAAGAGGREELAAERLAALRRAAPMLPDDAWPLNDVAWGLLEAGASGEALPLASRAARLAPASAPVQDTLAAVLADVGRCQEALLAQRRAVDLVAEREATAPVVEIRDRLARIEAQCGASAPGAR